jgi:4-hydroxy-tetrahydrodipicolinate synthase
MSQYTYLRGAGVAMVTPFNEDYSIDFEALGKLANHLIESHVDYLVLLGTTAESVTLSDDEKKSIVEHVVKINANRVPIVMGVGGNNTQAVVNALKSTNFDGISAILSVTPYYNKPNQEGLFLHYREISKATPLPIILYNVPGRTGTNLQSSTTIRLASEFENIIAVKEASGDFIQIMDLIRNRPKDFMVISGDDATTFPLMTLGGDGVISVIANAFPAEFSQMVRDVLNGDLEKSKAMQFRFSDIIKNLFSEGSPAGIKALLNIQGRIKNVLRLPLVPVSTQTYITLKDEMNEFYSSL